MLELMIDESVLDRLTLEERSLVEGRVRRMLDAAARAEGLGELEMSLRLTDDEIIWELNRDYRGKDSPTDVLAFSQREGEGPILHPEVLGDVVISLDTAARQARGDLLAELIFLAAHGLCHLLGYDHQTDEEEARMNARIEELLAHSAQSSA